MCDISDLGDICTDLEMAVVDYSRPHPAVVRQYYFAEDSSYATHASAVGHEYLPQHFGQHGEL